MTDSPVLAAAHAYAKRGWYVFPVRNATKTPHIKQWQKLATTEPKQIAAWWAKWPDADIGIACGLSGLLVVDLDVDDDPDNPKNGVAEWESLTDDDGTSLVMRTPRGGLQLIYTTDKEYKNSASVIAPNIDIRGAGGFFAVPPCNGRTWELDGDAEPVPDWLDALLTTTRREEGAERTVGATTLAGLLADKPGADDSGWNNWLTAVAGHLAKQCPFEDAYREQLQIIADSLDGTWQEGEVEKIATSIWNTEHTKKDAGLAELVAAPTDPMINARMYVNSVYGHEEHDTLIRHNGAFWHWTGTHWAILERPAVTADLAHRLEHAYYESAKGPTPFSPSPRKLNDIVGMIDHITLVPYDLHPPAWLNGEPPAPANEFVSVENGLLHLPTRKVTKHTPRYYTHHSLALAYDSKAAKPSRWLLFLDEILPDDTEAQDTLAEIAGYLISGDTSQQKIFAIIGPPRSGKGTFARILTDLLGPSNVVGPTTSSLASHFGLQPLVGKPVAIISDARLRNDSVSEFTERLLTISGEDTITIDRKHTDSITMKLGTRFLFLSNELPRMPDVSGALAKRFIMVVITESFAGKEDTHLTDKLRSELPGILNWALDGYSRLQERGHFVTPQSATEAQQEMADQAAPLAAFIRERCVIEASAQVRTESLYGAWEAWCTENHRDHAGTTQSFAKDLRAILPKIKTVKITIEGRQRRVYRGVGLRTGPYDEAEHSELVL
jgi:putative DNA primase/helicase